MTLSTKPELNNVSQGMAAEKAQAGKSGRMVREIYVLTDRETDRQTATIITILRTPTGSRVLRVLEY